MLQIEERNDGMLIIQCENCGEEHEVPKMMITGDV